MGLAEFKSFLNFDFYAAFSTISELLSVEDNHDFCKAEAITRYMAVSSMWTSLPSAIMSLVLLGKNTLQKVMIKDIISPLGCNSLVV